MRLRSLFIAALLVVAAALGWWWQRERVDARVAAPSVEEGSSSETQAPRSDRLAAPETHVAESRAEAAPSVVVSPEPAFSTPLAENEAWLEVTAVAKEDGRALSGVRIGAHPQDVGSWSASHVDSSEGSDSEMPLTDGNGRARLRLRAEIAYSVSASMTSAPSSRGARIVTPLVAGETRSVRFELATRADLSFFARVVAKDDRSPVAGATITQVRDSWEIDEGSVESIVAGAPVLRTDADGAFDALGESWRPAVLRIDAPGFGRRLVALRSGHETPEKALVIELARAGRLHVAVSGSADVGREPLTVTATANGHEIVHRESELEYVSAADQRWRVAVDSNGRANLVDLPPDVRLAVVLTAGERVLVRHPEFVTLAAGEERALDLEIGAGAVIAGILRDDGGRAVADTAVWLMAPGDGLRAFYSWEHPLQRVATDANGVFEFVDVAVGKWLVGLGAEDHATSKPELAGLPAEVIVSPRDRRVAVELHVTRGMSIAGRVVDRGGRAVAGVQVNAVGPGGVDEVESREDGGFSLAPVMPGTWHVWAGGSKGWAQSEWVAVQGGDQNLVLVAERGGSIVVSAVDEAGVRVLRGELVWSPESDDPQGTGTWMTALEDEDREIDDLRPGAWDVVVRTPDGGFGAERVSVEAGDEPKRVTVRVVPGGTLLVRNTKSEGPIGFVVRSAGLRVGLGAATADEPTNLAVPAGALRIEWTSPTTNDVRSRDIRIDVRQKLEIDLASD